SAGAAGCRPTRPRGWRNAPGGGQKNTTLGGTPGATEHRRETGRRQRSLQLAGDGGEGRGKVRADSGHDRHGGNRDQSGNQAVLNRRGAILVLEELGHSRKHAGSSVGS